MQSFTFLPGAHRPYPASTTTALAPLVKQETGWNPLDHISHSAVGFSVEVSPDFSYYNIGELPVRCSPSQNTPSLHPPPAEVPVPLQEPLHYPQSSSVPLQPPLIPPQAASYSSPPQPGSSRGTRVSVSPSIVTQVDAQKQNTGQVLNIKQEPEDQPNLGCLGLQEITLDDVNEIIDRDISGLSSLQSQFDPFQSYEWDHHKSKDALPFCGAPQ